MKKRTFLFILLILLVPAALVYLAAMVNANRKLKLHEEGLRLDRQAAIEFVAHMNELRVPRERTSLDTLQALVYPPLPPGYTLRAVTAADREKFPVLKDSDFLVQQNGPPHLLIPSKGAPVNLDLNASEAPPAAGPAK